MGRPKNAMNLTAFNIWSREPYQTIILAIRGLNEEGKRATQRAIRDRIEKNKKYFTGIGKSKGLSEKKSYENWTEVKCLSKHNFNECILTLRHLGVIKLVTAATRYDNSYLANQDLMMTTYHKNRIESLMEYELENVAKILSKDLKIQLSYEDSVIYGIPNDIWLNEKETEIYFEFIEIIKNKIMKKKQKEIVFYTLVMSLTNYNPAEDPLIQAMIRPHDIIEM